MSDRVSSLRLNLAVSIFFFFFNDTATTEIYTLSLHDALPIYRKTGTGTRGHGCRWPAAVRSARSEEHTSELQSRQYLVCRLLLAKKKTNYSQTVDPTTKKNTRTCRYTPLHQPP